MKIFQYLISIALFTISIFAQNNTKPKLVVGIVVDQMRFDYLERFYDDFDENGGFRKLLHKGTNFTNCTINYIQTVTAAGHASVYTGTIPYFHGIISNDWKDRNTTEYINACTAPSPKCDSVINGISYYQSPEQLISTTIGDQIRLNNYGKSKVFSISVKDRGALLPAGKGANGAFWFDDKTGKFISSFYYYKELPKWVSKYNNSGIINKYLEKDWNLLRSKEVYSDLPNDNSPYETDVFYENKTSFPHTYKNVPQEKLFNRLTHTPDGNQILVDLAKEAIINEELGKDKYIDHLAISFSTPDKIGHDYGPHSYEVKDNYLRLDLQLAELINFLDKHVGENEYILFLTADHGVMDNTQHLLDMNFDAKVLESTPFFNNLIDFLSKEYNSKKIIKTRYSGNLYLDYQEIEKLGLTKENVEKKIKEYLLFQVDEIERVFTRTELESLSALRESRNYILNGFNQKRSGDILYSLKANYLHWPKKYGSQHGSQHEYDNHIPLLFYGKDIPAETKNEQVYIVDIAATIANFIGVTQPSDCIGIPLLKKK